MVITDGHWCKSFLFLALVPVVFSDHDQSETSTEGFSADDFKCTLPDVTSVDDDLNVTRFRSDFSKISEVKFPGLIGPLNEKLICKIKCIDGNWVGPLCSSTPDGRFQPILRQCLYKNDHPLLAVTYKNSSLEKDTLLPHGSTVLARCKHFGYYKMKGESALHCENGDWVPKLPECVPTTVITNFTGDAPPTVLYTILSGSGVVGPAGALWVRPDSSLRLDCVSPRALGEPTWTWTHPHPHTAGWSTEEGESETHYRLSLARLTARHGGRYTCSARGHTHTVAIRVVSECIMPIAERGRRRRGARAALRAGLAAGPRGALQLPARLPPGRARHPHVHARRAVVVSAAAVRGDAVLAAAGGGAAADGGGVQRVRRRARRVRVRVGLPARRRARPRVRRRRPLVQRQAALCPRVLPRADGAGARAAADGARGRQVRGGRAGGVRVRGGAAAGRRALRGVHRGRRLVAPAALLPRARADPRHHPRRQHHARAPRRRRALRLR